MSRKYLTIEEISKEMRISVGTARNRLACSRPMPPNLKADRRRLFPEDEFAKWMKNLIEESIQVGSFKEASK